MSFAGAQKEIDKLTEYDFSTVAKQWVDDIRSAKERIVFAYCSGLPHSLHPDQEAQIWPVLEEAAQRGVRIIAYLYGDSNFVRSMRRMAVEYDKVEFVLTNQPFPIARVVDRDRALFTTDRKLPHELVEFCYTRGYTRGYKMVTNRVLAYLESLGDPGLIAEKI